MDTTNGQPIHVEKTFKRSESIAALMGALAKAQGMMQPAKKDSSNPYFKSKYADLASVIEAIREPFSKNGLAFVQFPRESASGVEVETLIGHSSGEWMSETLRMPVQKSDAQAVGSAITYGRRYGLQSMAGVPAEDDDGNAASAAIKPDLKLATMKVLNGAAEQGTAALEAAWKQISPEARKSCQGELSGLKKKAEEAGELQHA